MRIHRNPWPAFVAGLVITLPGAAVAQQPTAEEQRIKELEQRLLVLERKLEIAEEDQTKKKAETPVVKADNKGFSVTSADQAFQLKLRGYVQADGRFVDEDHSDT